MRRPLVLSLLAVLVVSGGALAATLATGRSPKLGLDLQGGAAVVLRPEQKVPSGVLTQSIEIIRNRVDALGVAEPEISRQGDNIIVQLPGVKNTRRALDVVGQTAELRFRPVLEPNVPPAEQSDVKTTPREEDRPEREVVLPGKDGDVRYRLGPAELTGRILEGARAEFDATTGQWKVNFTLNDEGSKAFDELAARNVNKQVAIVLDGVVQSAPTIQTANFGGSGEITGDFTEREAKDLALVLRFGSLPVELRPETVQTVSASLGRDSLQAGVGAGLMGLALVLVYMVFYYRSLGLVVILGLGVSGMTMWSLVSFLGDQGLALTLAGAVGIIVSVGVTVDSYVVYFERLKDEVRSGKTIRSSVDRGFSRAYRTILVADFASLIGAALLYWLAVGSVRGFAFFLGLSTVLDMVVAYFFTRPMVVLLGRNRLFTEARWLGVARGLAAAPAGGAQA